MLVDDEPDITLAFKMGLGDNGFVVDAFDDPLLALSSFKDGLYNMAILDKRMPKIDGFELGNEIRKLDDVVEKSLMSAFDIQEERLKLAGSILNEEEPLFMTKPISMDEFVLRIQEKVK
jgi:DNA-binding response OmpR family regulator